ncbi:MAG: pyruvate carboxylase [Bacillota bacterium]|nr:pyruvate carboxylase [Bacillota bacterium]
MERKRDFHRVLVANRGEIATRVFQACTELGKRTVAIYAEADLASLHRVKADEAYPLGAGRSPVAAYLDIEGIVRLAREKRVDAIHPGYGFLSENADFARACRREGIAFIGPEPGHLELFGDKLAARRLAREAGVPVLPGTEEPVTGDGEALAFAREHGFPLMVKAVAGGGGRGIRLVRTPEELREALAAARREAAGAFGRADLYLEVALERPKHVEVQILADASGAVIDLGERDCSVQRRHQKMVEMAPAVGLDPGLRRELRQAAVELMRRARYVNAGTVEFLVGADGRFAFLEVNPRIQVEHTVTELVTGVDLVQAQIRIAEGWRLGELGGILPDPERVEPRGVAIQCRVTSEDPARDFLPDTGRITAFRAPGGFGVRLDVGAGHPGAEVTPWYDPLLVKVSTWGSSLEQAAAKMDRALREFRVRGVRTNLPFLENVVRHPDFLAGRATVDFVESHPELFRFPVRRDRGSKLLRYIGEVTVNGAAFAGVPAGAPRPRAGSAGAAGPGEAGRARTPGAAREESTRSPRRLLEEEGPEALARWARERRELLLCETSLRDGHQSLLATRVRTRDLVALARAAAPAAGRLFAMEVWGGATFDSAYRFLREDPWARLEALRRELPETLFMMLLRGQSLVGYGAYPDNLVRAFVREAAGAGVDLFRIFDSLNDLENIRVAVEAVREAGKVAEVAICTTGDLLEEGRRRYDLAYYVRLAREAERAGAHFLAIKDMAGLLKPEAARRLVTALREAVDLPIHLHTHDTAGTGVATVLAAAGAGLDLADAAVGAMAGGSSQPSLQAILAGLEGSGRHPGLSPRDLEAWDGTWRSVRRAYAPFEAEPGGPDASVYRFQVPGGQLTNLRQQAQALGLGDRWQEVLEAYAAVDRLLGEPVKVTPSSKMVGDFALWLVQRGIRPEELEERAEELDFPASVVDYFRGLLGRPPYGYPERLRRAVLKGQPPLEERPGAALPPADLEAASRRLARLMGRIPTSREVLSWLLFPQVFEEFVAHQQRYGETSVLETPVFFYGLAPGEATTAEIEPGKLLAIRLNAVGEADDRGERTLFFELNGSPRETRVTDLQRAPARTPRAKADPADPAQVGAALRGRLARLRVQPGDRVHRGQPLLVLEAMKMETTLTAPMDGRVARVELREGEEVEPGDLLLLLQPEEATRAEPAPPAPASGSAAGPRR